MLSKAISSFPLVISALPITGTKIATEYPIQWYLLVVDNVIQYPSNSNHFDG